MCYKNNREDSELLHVLLFGYCVSAKKYPLTWDKTIWGGEDYRLVSVTDGMEKLNFFFSRYGIFCLFLQVRSLFYRCLCAGGVGQTFHFCKLQGQYTAQYTVSEWGEGTQTKQMWFSIRTNTITDTCLLSSHSSSEFPDLIETRGWKHEWVTSST